MLTPYGIYVLSDMCLSLKSGSRLIVSADQKVKKKKKKKKRGGIDIFISVPG